MVVQTFDDMMSGWFKFVQTEDGSVPAIFHKPFQQLFKLTLRVPAEKSRLIRSLSMLLSTRT